MVYLSESEIMNVTTSGGKKRACPFCSRTAWCVEAAFSFDVLEDVESFVCERCLSRIQRFAFDPAMRTFLRAYLNRFAEYIAWRVDIDRRDKGEKEWPEAVRLLYLAFTNAMGPESRFPAVSRALEMMTGMDAGDAKKMIEKVFAEEKEKAALTATGDWATASAIAYQLVRIAGDNPTAKQIDMMINVMHQSSGLEPQEARRMIEAAMEVRATKKMNGTPVPAARK